MYKPVRSTNHALRAPSRFIEQFKKKPVMTAMLVAFMNQVQDLENALWEIILLRNIVDGEGVILDMIGRIVGRKREGLIDTDYRIALRAQIRINRSVGKAVDVINVAILSLPDGVTFSYSEAYPAGIVVEVDPLVDFNVSVLWRNLKATKAGGVRLFLILTYVDPANAFTLRDYSSGGYAGRVYDNAQGLGYHADPTLGGGLTTVMGS